MVGPGHSAGSPQHRHIVENGAPVSHPHPELQRPPLLAKKALRIVGLGGLGEIGRNMNVF